MGIEKWIKEILMPFAKGHMIFKLGKKDKELCDLFSNNYPSNGNMALFLKNHDIRVSFKDDIITEIDNFCNSWNDVDHEFINKNLEKTRKQFLIELNKYRKELVPFLDSNETGNRLKFKINNKWQDKKHDIADSFNEKGNYLYNIHQILTQKN